VLCHVVCTPVPYTAWCVLCHVVCTPVPYTAWCVLCHVVCTPVPHTAWCVCDSPSGFGHTYQANQSCPCLFYTEQTAMLVYSELCSGYVEVSVFDVSMMPDGKVFHSSIVLEK